MEGKTSKYSISAWRKNAKEKRNITKREHCKKKNQEKLAEKARENEETTRPRPQCIMGNVYYIDFCHFLRLKNYKIVL